MYCGELDFAIISLKGLKKNLSNMISHRRKLNSDNNDLIDAIKKLKENWQNDKGRDIESIIEGLNDVQSIIEEDLLEMVSNCIDEMTDIIALAENNNTKK